MGVDSPWTAQAPNNEARMDPSPMWFLTIYSELAEHVLKYSCISQWVFDDLLDCFSNGWLLQSASNDHDLTYTITDSPTFAEVTQLRAA